MLWISNHNYRPSAYQYEESVCKKTLSVQEQKEDIDLKQKKVNHITIDYNIKSIGPCYSPVRN